MIDIPDVHLETILNTLKKYLPSTEVRVFGSRYKHSAKRYSDLDLALVGRIKLDQKLLTNIKEDFEDSNIPFRIDLLDWNAISPEFRKIIENDGFEVIY